MDNETRLCFYQMYTCGVSADGEGAGTAGSVGSGVAAAGEHRRKNHCEKCSHAKTI